MFSISKIRMPLRCVFVIVLFLIFLVPTNSLAKVFEPYTGKVLDMQIGKPIKGASLFVYLGGYIPTHNLEERYYQKSALVHTDKDGKYSIPKTLTTSGLPDSQWSIIIIIYQPGYQVYINRDSSWNKKPNNAKKEGNIITLERISPNFDHKKHYEKIINAFSEIGEIEIIPPIDYYASPKGDTRMDWDKFVDKSRPSILKEEFLRCVEWERRRE